MPRYHNSFADAVIANSRPIARAKAIAAEQAARAVARNAPEALTRDAARRSIRVESDLAAVVDRAAERVAMLKANLSAARLQIGRMSDNAFITGTVNEAASHIRNRIAELPALIERAEAELDAARRALAGHRDSMVAIRAACEAPAEVENAPEDAAEPVPAAAPARGRGRPAKVIS